jgi:hypothetical protein
MLPESAPPEQVAEATLKRRLEKRKLETAAPNLYVKKVRKSEPQWLGTVISFYNKQSEEIASIKAAIETSNTIQQERITLLQKLLNNI